MLEMTPKEAAELFETSMSSLYRRLKSAKIRGEKRGGRWVVFVESTTSSFEEAKEEVTMSVRGVAWEAGISTSQAYNWLADGKIKGYKVGKWWHIETDENGAIIWDETKFPSYRKKLRREAKAAEEAKKPGTVSETPEIATDASDSFERLFGPVGDEETQPADTVPLIEGEGEGETEGARVERESIRKAHQRINELDRRVGRVTEDAAIARFDLRTRIDAIEQDIKVQKDQAGKRHTQLQSQLNETKEKASHMNEVLSIILERLGKLEAVRPEKKGFFRRHIGG